MCTDDAHPYGGMPPHRGVDTSIEAAESVKHITPGVRATVLDLIRGAGSMGHTDDEIERHLDRSHQSVSPRRCELMLSGEVVWSGLYRKTRTGRKARVWVTPEYGPRRIDGSPLHRPRMNPRVARLIQENTDLAHSLSLATREIEALKSKVRQAQEPQVRLPERPFGG